MIRVGSVLRGADGRRYRITRIRKAEPHGGFSQVAHFEAPEPLPFKRRKRRHRLNERYFPDGPPCWLT
jgi:hypothetical protein